MTHDAECRDLERTLREANEQLSEQTAEPAARNERLRAETEERGKAEDALRRVRDELEMRIQERTRDLADANRAVQAERQRFHDLLETLPAYLILLTPDYRVAFANRFFRERFGESLGRRCYEYLFGREEPCEVCETYKVLKTDAPVRWEWTGPDGRIYDIYDFPFTDSDGSPMIMEMGIDITERRQAEEALKEINETLEQRVAERTSDLAASERKYRTLFSSMSEGFGLLRIICDEAGNPVDYEFLEINDGFERQTGLKRENLIGRTVLEVLPGIEPFWIETFGRVALTGEPARFDGYSSVLGRWYEAYAYSPVRGQFAVVFSDVTERKRAEEELKAAYERESHISQVLQKAIVPPEPFISDDYPTAAVYVPAYAGEEVGGDFYDVFRLDDGRVGTLIGDVSGKGVEAASLAAMTRSTVRALAYVAPSPGQAIAHANEVICRTETGGAFVTVHLFFLEPGSGRVVYTSAGHPPPAVLRADGRVEFVAAGGLPLGAMPDQVFAEGEYSLEPGDEIVLYTDGVNEARIGANLFGYEGIERVLRNHAGKSPKCICDELLAAVKSWASEGLRDDTAIVVIRRDRTDSESSRRPVTSTE